MDHEEIILRQPKLLTEGMASASKIKISGDFEQIIICGMGGSALPGEFLKFLILNETIKQRVRLCRDYRLPPQVDQKALVIAISYSGNTEETLACFKESAEKKLHLVGISSGGELEKLSLQNGIPFVKISNDPPVAPRFGMLTMLGALLQILANSKIIEQELVERAKQSIENIKPETLKKQGLEIAEFLKDKIAVIYTSSSHKVLAKNWKLKLNESAQIPCFINYFSELNHNELASFSNKNLTEKLAVLMFKADDEEKRIAQRMDLTSKLLEQKGIPVKFLSCSENNIWERKFKNSLLGDWTAFALANYYGVDPASSEIIEKFKKELGK